MFSPPLPPLSTTYLLDAILSQFLDDEVGCFRYLLGWNIDVLGPDPSGMGHTTSSEGLKVLECMM